MVIGFDGSRSFNLNKTGTENYSYQLLNALSKIDKKNKYVVFVRSNSQIEGDLPDNFIFKTINWSRLWTQGGLASQTFKEKIDILFVPAHTIPLIKKPLLKTVVTVHDLGSEYLPKMHQLKQRLYLSFMQKYQLKSATKIIAVSNATKQDLIKKIGIEPQKITVVYEGFDKNLFKPVKNDALINSLRQYNIYPGKYFLFVGTIQPRKNLEMVIRAFSKYLEVVNTADLVIAGSKGWLSDPIYALPKQLGIQNQVKFINYVPDKDLPSLYSGAKALIFASLFEGFGLPILEAQACGCPVLTSNTSSMPEIAGKGAVLVDPNSQDDIVKGMLEIQNSKLRAQNLIKKGFENTKKFSWEKCALETLEVFKNL